MMLLAASYFVLLTVRKAESTLLKAFGHILAVLLWISAALVFSAGIYIVSSPNVGMMHQMMMRNQMRGGMTGSYMQNPQMGGQMQGQMMPGMPREMQK
jgi:hypothetical protein